MADKSSNKLEMQYYDFLLDNGEIIVVEVPMDSIDEAWEEICNAVKLKGWWTPANINGGSAKYLGIAIDSINMSRVIATL